MLHRLLFFSRPFGISLGLFTVVNFGLALKEPKLSANQVWISVPIPEPWLSAFALLAGVALLLPHEWSARQTARFLQAGVLLGFMILAGVNVASYYGRILREEISSGAVFPYSLLIVVILGAEVARVLLWKPASVSVPKPARRFFGTLLVGVACFVMVLAHVYTFGMTDYSEAVGHADAAVVLGAKVNPDGTLSSALEDRLVTGVRLYREQVVDRLIMSGGIDVNGLSEPRAMADWAERHGVPPSDIILDEQGNNTYRSAVNCAELARQAGFEKLVVVSQYFHNARVKLIFERAGVRCYTVPAVPERRFRREAYYLFREAVAYPYYLLFHH